VATKTSAADGSLSKVSWEQPGLSKIFEGES
jgi:hypothetical protein